MGSGAIQEEDTLPALGKWRPQGPTLLLVEGKEDENFFRKMAKDEGIEGIEVKSYDGKPRLRRFLKATTFAREFSVVKSIGIVRDADTSQVDAMKSVTGAIAATGKLALPGELGADGIAAANPAVGMLVLPGSGRPGMLETLLRDSLEGNRIVPCIDAFMACSEELGIEISRPDKMFVHSYIATQPKPHVSVGVAAQMKYWDLGHAVFDEVRRFLHELAQAAR